MFIIPKEIEYIIENIENNGYEAYIVGGCVRDILMSIKPHDYDVTTSASPEKITEIFDKTIPTGIKHGTVTVLIGDYSVEVTTYRCDGEYRDHRRPEGVRFVKTLKEDLARRDFTVNAIAYNHNKGLQDFFGGINDIKDGVLRAVGEPEKRFTEDALRILRLFRFASVLGFKIDDSTLKAAVSCSNLLKNISAERISVELNKTLCGNNPEALKPLTDSKAFNFLGIKGLPNYEKIYELSKYELALFTFLYSSKADLIEVLDKLKTPNKDKKLAHSLLTLLELPFPTDKIQIKEMLNISNIDVFEKYIIFQKIYFEKDVSDMQNLFIEIIDRCEPYKIQDIKIKGRDLAKIGLTGENIGAVLEKLRQSVVKNPDNNKYSILLKNAEQLKRN